MPAQDILTPLQQRFLLRFGESKLSETFFLTGGTALPNARQKHVGLDDYWLAISLLKVNDLDILPRLIKPVQREELKAFFLAQAKMLMA